MFWEHGITYPTEIGVISRFANHSYLQVQSFSSLSEGRFKCFETLRRIDWYQKLPAFRRMIVPVFSGSSSLK
jgi:hypothetical protein